MENSGMFWKKIRGGTSDKELEGSKRKNDTSVIVTGEYHETKESGVTEVLRLGGPSAKARLGGGSLDHLMEAKR